MMEQKLPVKHPWVCVDLDGTLMEDGHYPDFGPPIPGAKEACEWLHQNGVKIMVFTARTCFLDLDGSYLNVNRVVESVLAWGRTHGIQIDYVFPMPKPTYVLAFFDDRAIRVTPDAGGWPTALETFRQSYMARDWKRDVLPPERPEQRGMP